MHALWVSKAVLQLLGDLPQSVKGGMIVRNGEGEATGIFLDNAMKVVSEFFLP